MCNHWLWDVNCTEWWPVGLNTGYVWQVRTHQNTHIHARTLSCCVAASLWRLFRLEDVFVAQLLSWWWDGMICIKPNPNCDCGVDTFLASCAVQDDLLTDVKKKTCVFHSTLSGLLEFSPVLRYFISGMGSTTRFRSYSYTVVL